jgi:hypothetical protein
MAIVLEGVTFAYYEGKIKEAEDSCLMEDIK